MRKILVGGILTSILSPLRGEDEEGPDSLMAEIRPPHPLLITPEAAQFRNAAWATCVSTCASAPPQQFTLKTNLRKSYVRATF